MAKFIGIKTKVELAGGQFEGGERMYINLDKVISFKYEKATNTTSIVMSDVDYEIEAQGDITDSLVENGE